MATAAGAMAVPAIARAAGTDGASKPLAASDPTVADSARRRRFLPTQLVASHSRARRTDTWPDRVRAGAARNVSRDNTDQTAAARGAQIAAAARQFAGA